MHSVNPAQARQKAHEIRTARERVQKRIEEIKRQLKLLESMPGSPPWVSFHRVKTVQEFVDNHNNSRTLRRELESDLALLEVHLRDLKKIRIPPTPAEAARSASQDFDKRLEEVLEDAEKRGSLSPGELEELRAGSEEVLQHYVELLIGAPTEKNMELVLGKMETPLALGSEMHGEILDKAWRTLGHASEVVLARVDLEFRKKPTASNLDKLLQSRTTAQVVGGHVPEHPADWSPAQTTHQVALGDTLSALSEQYYGDMSHWDVIYIANYGAIGDDVKQLRVGTHLTIP